MEKKSFKLYLHSLKRVKVPMFVPKYLRLLFSGFQSQLYTHEYAAISTNEKKNKLIRETISQSSNKIQFEATLNYINRKLLRKVKEVH